jgi:post-segregation antitoxin (ccd killing protein)
MSFDRRTVEGAAMMLRQSRETQSRRSAAKTRAIKLHIERLVLHGFSAADRHHIADQVQAELLRLFTEGKALRGVTGAIAVERTGAETFNHRANASAQVTGAHIAQAVYRGLQTSTGPSKSPVRRG